MNKSKIFRGALLVALTLLFWLPTVSASPTNLPSFCAANAGCAKQRAVLRQLEKTRPSKKVTRRQIFNRIKAACEKMRNLDCPELRNYQPTICFTDF